MAVTCDVISGTAVEDAGLDVCVNVGCSRSNISWDIRPTHFVATNDDERQIMLSVVIGRSAVIWETLLVSPDVALFCILPWRFFDSTAISKVISRFSGDSNIIDDVMGRYCSIHVTLPFLSLDEAIASWAVFVIVSGSDGQADERTETLLVRDRPYVSMGS